MTKENHHCYPFFCLLGLLRAAQLKLIDFEIQLETLLYAEQDFIVKLSYTLTITHNQSSGVT